jgi:hypothetical protein
MFPPFVPPFPSGRCFRQLRKADVLIACAEQRIVQEG